jgi:hypothetical protein
VHDAEAAGNSSVAPLICLAGAAAGSGTVLLILQSHLTFFADDWEFLLNRRGLSVGVFLDPHNDHIAVAPVAIYKALLAVFGMGSALPFQVVSTLIFLLSAALLFVYLRRRVGDWPALLGSTLILFLGAAYTDLLWSFQMGFFGSAAAGIGALLALDRDDRKGDLVACALLVLAISFSELGVPFAAGALVSVALGPSPRRNRVYVALVPLAFYGIWYLGWGHKASNTASFHNLVNSPRFVFDSVSENLTSLFGLATPLSGNAGGPNLIGVNWGRILLVIAIGLALWRLRRVGWKSRRLWAVLAAGGAFWFLTALNAVPFLRAPTASRYQYGGAIFVLLIAAELLRGARADKRLVTAATVVTVAASISGLILLHDAYRVRKDQSDGLRAELGAVAIGRSVESPDFAVGFPPFYIYPARVYFSAVDAYGSPAFSESQLVATVYGISADRLLAGVEGIKLRPVRGARATGAQAQTRCHTLNALRSGLTALALPPGGYTLRDESALGATAQAARYAALPSVSLGLLRRGAPASITVPADRSTRPWRLYSPSPTVMTVCSVVGR